MKGVLLIYTGVPKSPHSKDVSDFQTMILEDPYVIKQAHGIPEFSDYEISQEVINDFEKFRSRVVKKIRNLIQIPICTATRYNKNSIHKGMSELMDKGVNQILIFPMFPHLASSTVQSVFEESKIVRDTYFLDLTLEFFGGFPSLKEYSKHVSEILNKEIQTTHSEHIIFSYHGVPEHFSMTRDGTKNECQWDGSCCNSDDENEYCYKKECFKTTELIANQLELASDEITTSFHSRLGLESWLFPTTLKTVENLAKKGIKKIALICPGIVISDLEFAQVIKTAKTTFLKAGGEEFIEISPLNDDENWAKQIAFWIDRWRIIDFETAIA